MSDVETAVNPADMTATDFQEQVHGTRSEDARLDGDGESRLVGADDIDFTARDPGRVAAELIDYAVSLPASDLFIDSDEESVHVSVRFLGILRHVARIDLDSGRRLLNYFKAVGGMDLGQKLRPCDGRWVFAREDNRKTEIRINTSPGLFGENMAIRLLDRNQRILELEELGMSERDVGGVQRLVSGSNGLILVTGPTGAGKTTTLYSCLRRLNNGQRRICTIEDPIEYALPGVRQSQVNLRIGLDFPDLLRSVMRQSADVILVGEIRDPVTAETAVLASKSGQLVLATLHASTAAGAVDSMLSFGIHPYFLASGLAAVITQRLLRTLCPHCKLAVDISDSPDTFDEVRRWLKPNQGKVIYAAVGCQNCRYEGHAGLTGVFEVLRVSREIRRLINERATVREIRDQAVREGMMDVRREALLKVAEGTVSIEEVMRAIPVEYLLPSQQQ
jgi:type II secretory ATPase GspE/PulE/Tfp pilus assembly ATPase PilB-like protein